MSLKQTVKKMKNKTDWEQIFAACDKVLGKDLHLDSPDSKYDDKEQNTKVTLSLPGKRFVCQISTWECKLKPQ